MEATQVFCPNMDCPARGQTGKGNIGVHNRKEKRYQCRECRKTFAETVGTPFYRLRTGMEVVVLVVTLLAHGCPIRAMSVATRLWIVGAVSEHQDLKLVMTLMERVKASASALAGAILFCTDGFAESARLSNKLCKWISGFFSMARAPDPQNEWQTGSWPVSNPESAWSICGWRCAAPGKAIW